MCHFGIKDYAASFYWDTDTETLGAVYIDYKGRAVSFYLAKKWPTGRVTNKQLDRTAFHEVIHVILAPLTAQITKDDTKEAGEHEIIRRFESERFGLERIS